MNTISAHGNINVIAGVCLVELCGVIEYRVSKNNPSSNVQVLTYFSHHLYRACFLVSIHGEIFSKSKTHAFKIEMNIDLNEYTVCFTINNYWWKWSNISGSLFDVLILMYWFWTNADGSILVSYLNSYSQEALLSSSHIVCSIMFPNVV